MAVTDLTKEAQQQKIVQQLKQRQEKITAQTATATPQMMTNVQANQATIQRNVTVGQPNIMSDIAPIEEGRVQIDRLKGKDAKKKIVSRRKSREFKPVDPNEMADIERFAQSKWAKENWLNKEKSGFKISEIREQVQNGNYDHFEKLDDVFRDIEATKRMVSFNRDYLGGYNGSEYQHFDQETVERVVDRLEKENKFFDPVLRLGLSQYANLEIEHGNESVYRRIDNEIAKRIMIKTLTHKMNENEQAAYKQKLIDSGKATSSDVGAVYDKELMANKAKTTQMVKQLFLMHLGKLQIVDRDSNTKQLTGSRDVDVPMASTLAHCSRTLIVTPNFTDDNAEQEMWNSILRQKDVNGTYINQANIYKRGAATHSVERRDMNARYVEEIKKKVIAPNFIRQTGMDVAIGGLGAAGVGGKMLDQDGSCGHVYGMRKRSKKGKNGAYMFGYESDSYKHTNQLGHTHNLMAVGEKSSSFLCQRSDEIGAKYAGRQADISRIPHELIVKCMNNIDDIFMRDMYGNKTDIVKKLCGNLLNNDDFAQLLGEMNIEQDFVNRISTARG